MAKLEVDPPTATAGPAEELVRQLVENLGGAFDLSTAIGDRTLGEAVERRIRALPSEGSPRWGETGDMAQVARLGAGPLDFYYRPHLFPDMDPALRLGHHLQFDLLPRELPAASPLRVAAVLESYCHLSGDLLGWCLEGDELFLWVADVCGHGVRAGLAAAVLYFLVEAGGFGGEPAAFAEHINESILNARNPADERPLFATAFWLRFGADGRGVYASSGHPPMLLRRASGDVEQLVATGPPAGMMPRQRVGQAELRLAPGDSLCLFTDGLTEATDPAGEEFGRRRLTSLLRDRPRSPLDATRAIYSAVTEHNVTSLLEDDLTFLVVEPAA